MKFVPGVTFTAYGHEDPDRDDEDQMAVVYVLTGIVVEPTEEERTRELYDPQAAGRVASMEERNRTPSEDDPDRWLVVEITGIRFEVKRQGQLVEDLDELMDDESWSGVFHPLIDALREMRQDPGYESGNRWFARESDTGELDIDLGDFPIAFDTITTEG